ncbi:MAG: family 10 glycosylhydrolase [Bacteroidota bacterium]
MNLSLRLRASFAAFVLLFNVCVAFGQQQKSKPLASDAELLALANKYVHTPVKKISQPNGDVFLQRNLSPYLHANLTTGQVQAGDADEGHSHNDAMLEEFLNRPQPAVATLKKYFTQAASEFKVPVELLMAAAQVQSNWAQVSESMYGSWGVMGIIENQYIQQITAAASLLKTTPEKIKDDAQMNIRAAAALLAHYQQNKAAVSLDDWFDAVRQLTGLTNEKMKTELAVRIYELMKTGSKTVTLWGEIIYLEPVTNKKILEDIALPQDTDSPNGTTAVDYPNAIAGFSTCPTNYGTRPVGAAINFYFVHYIALGTYQGTLSWFSNCASGVSAHYVVRNSDGQITQVVAEADRAFSQGVSLYNNEGIGTEHEVLVANLTMWDSKPMLAAAGSLAADVCNRHSIPKVRRVVNGDRGIYGHSDVRATDCPNMTPERWDTLMNRIVTTTTIVNNQSIAIPVLYSIENPGSGTQLTATWKASTDANLVGYRLYYATNDALSSWALAASESTLTAADSSITLTESQFTVPPATNAHHFKLVSVVSNGANPNIESASSDIYSRSSNVAGQRVLIVDGFDRPNGSYTAATHPFAASYFKALRDRGLVQVSSVANEKVEDGTFLLTNYDIVVWFVGDESGVNIVFSASEKAKIQTFLSGGGKLFVSGSEIAYNLGKNSGAQAATYDLPFMNGYLKSNYVGDGGAGYSPATAIAGTDFAGLSIPFGVVYAEDFPDDIAAVAGATNIFNYAVAAKRGGVAYKGTFGAGTVPGALIFISWTLETATDIGMSAFMEKALAYFGAPPVPVAPVAVADAATAQSGSAKRIGILSNDVVNAASFLLPTLAVMAAPANGSVNIDAEGNAVYISNPGFTGIDSFTYRIQNSSNLLSNTVKVTITVVAATPCNPNAPEVDDAHPKRELRGAWVASVSNIDWPSSRTLTTAQQQAELLKILDTLSNTRINTVFLQIRPESDALYASSIEPWSYWLTNAQGTAPSPFWDPLQFAIEQAHARGMELHAWINPFRAKQSTPTLAPNHVAALHTDWVFVAGTATLLNPGLPMVREYLTNVIADIATRYDVDGIHFDDYFYPYPPNQIVKQDSATYVDYNPTNIATIADWRRNNINQLIGMVYDTLQIINTLNNRNVIFGVSPFGIWKAGTPPGIVGTSSYSDIYCDPIAWLQAGKVDYVAPQLYWKVTGAQDYLALSKWWNDQAVLYNRHIYPGLATYRLADASNWEAPEIQGQLDINRSGTHGQVLGQIMFSNKQIMLNSKGIKTALQNNQYRYRSFAPPMSWKDAVCPNSPTNLRFDADSLKWNAPEAAADGDTAVKYIVYRFASAAEASTNQQDGKKILAIIAGRKWTLPTTLARNGFIVVTALDKNNNESEGSSIISFPLNICSGGNAFFYSQNQAAGNTYQWQVNDGNGFVNVTNDANYSGANADTLQLTAIPSSWSGYTYRSLVTNGTLTNFSPVYTLKFGNTWTGAADTAWENIANWSCGSLPDEFTDVYINSGLINYPTINSNVSCRSVKAMPGATVNIQPGFTLEMKGQGSN